MTHPYKTDATLIDYTFCSLAIPPMLLGIKAGVLLNMISPGWFISFLLILLYSISTLQQLLGTLKIQRQETTMAQLMHKVEADVAALDAVAESLPPGEEPSDAVKHALVELQHDIQEIAYLSHEVMKQEARSLPPQLLQRTTNTIIRSTIDSLWLLPSGNGTPPAAAAAAAAGHGRTVVRSASLQHIKPPLPPTSSGPVVLTLPRSSTLAVSSRGGYSRSSSSSSRFLQALKPSLSRHLSSKPQSSLQESSGSLGLSAAGYAPVAAAAAAAVPELGLFPSSAQSNSQTPISQPARAVRHSGSLPSRSTDARLAARLADYRRSFSLTDHKTHGTAAAAAGNRAAFSHSRSMGRRHREPAVIGVSTSSQQLVDLARVLVHAPSLARMLSRQGGVTSGSGGAQHELLLHADELAGRSPRMGSPLGGSPLGGSPYGGSPLGGSPRGGSPRRRQQRAAESIPEEPPVHVDPLGSNTGSPGTQLGSAGKQKSTLSQSNSFGLLSDSPFASQSSLRALSRVYSKRASLRKQAEAGQADAADAAADIEAGLAELAGEATCSSKLQQFLQQLLQLLTWQGLQRAGSSVAAGAARWWQQQPKQQLLVVFASFVVYAVVNGLLTTMPQCGVGHFVVLGAFVVFTAAATFAATRLQWRATAAAAAAAAAVEEQLLLMPELPHKAGGSAASSAGTTPDALKDVGIVLAADRSHSCIKQQQQQLKQGSTACIGTAAADASDCKACKEDDGGSTTSSGLTDSEDVLGTSSSSNCISSPAAAAAGSAQQPAAADSAADDAASMQLNQPYDEILWSRSLLLCMPGGMFVVGLVSGLLGCSPNTLFLTPLLLHLNCHPQVAAATLKLALFVSSACSSLSYLLNGQLLLSFGLAFGIANLLTTPLGQWLMDAWIAKTGRPSLIMVAAVARNLASIPLLIAFNGAPGVIDLMHHTNVAFKLYKLAC
uniref:Uncharacterized protein n=1 Tax=Tetradesmus obliquus TaxID=3088 RepID=A0A383VUK2_TETOB|eukprot:jgi/Sobl393_1/14940/SZX68600.1